MPQRVTAKRIAPEQNDVNCKHDGPNTNSKSIWKPRRLPNVDGEHDQKKHREIEKISMHILHDEREGSFAPIGLARLAHGAGRRVGPERFVVRATIVVTSQAKSPRSPEN